MKSGLPFRLGRCRLDGGRAWLACPTAAYELRVYELRVSFFLTSEAAFVSAGAFLPAACRVRLLPCRRGAPMVRNPFRFCGALSFKRLNGSTS